MTTNMDLTEIRDVSWIGEEFLRPPVRGVVLSFHGLGQTGAKSGPTTEEIAWAQAGGLVVFPYYGPWSWMNRAARAFVDDLVDAIYRHYKIPDSAPLISTGGSMGGCSSLLYTRYARRPVAACLAACPVCDVKYHFSERPDLPRTFRHAFRGYQEPWDEILAEHSPLAQAARMPDIPYMIVHGDKDKAVNKARHSDKLVAALRKRKLNVRYVEVPGMGHGSAVPIDAILAQQDFVCGVLEGR